jgi:hypothetical protein
LQHHWQLVSQHFSHMHTVSCPLTLTISLMQASAALRTSEDLT